MIFRMRKILFLTILSSFVQIFAAAWTGSTSEPQNTEEINGKTFYVITTADELAWFAAQVNGGNNAINAVLGNDIVFGEDTTKYSSSTWPMIGNSSKQFAGIFDGRNHTVYGIHLTANAEVGFFGYIAEDGVVENLTLNNFDPTELGKSGDFVRGIFAAVNFGTIDNCVNRSIVKIYTTGSTGYAGGIVAKNYGKIHNTSNFGEISVGDQNVSGNSYSGGIAAYNDGTIFACENGEKIDSHVARVNHVGGIVAINTSNGVVQKSYNTAFVTSAYDKTYSVYGPGAYNGGIIAYNEGLVENAYNEGQDSSYQNVGNVYIGGIVGYNTGSSAVVRNSFAAISKLGAHGSYSYSGGIAGTNVNSGSIVNSYYDATLLPSNVAVKSQNATITDVSGKATAEMQTDEFAYILNTANKTEESSKVWSRDGGYPIFAGEYKAIDFVKLVDGDGNEREIYTDNEGNVADVYYYVKFFNMDGSLLDSQQVAYMAMPEYAGDEPFMDSTAQYIYTYAGWDKEIVAATANANYIAVYDSVVRLYSIVFRDYDGTILDSSILAYGADVEIPEAPSRESTAQYSYELVGYDKEVVAVEKS